MGFEKLTEKYEVEKQQWDSGFDKKAQQKMAAVCRVHGIRRYCTSAQDDLQ